MNLIKYTNIKQLKKDSNMFFMTQSDRGESNHLLLIDPEK